MIAALDKITGALEKHTADMNYTGTDEFNVHTFSRHAFDDASYDVLHDLGQRIERIGDDLCSAEDERHSYADLTTRQQESRTAEFEELAQEARSGAEHEAEWRQGATARETAWAALPPKVTAPGRSNDSVHRCRDCGGIVETIDGIHRCWACFRRGQDGR